MADAVDQKLLKRTKFPPEFSQKVDMRKVNVEVMKKWIAGRIAEILGTEDDIVTELCFNLLESERFPNIKLLQIQLTGFLDKDTAGFCKELWSLCLSAQANPQGVPKELLEAKKLELINEKLEAEKAAEVVRKQREQDRARDRDHDNVRQRERGERGRGRGRGAFRGRGDQDLDRRSARRSPSPHSRRSEYANSRAPLPRRGDTYAPSNGRRRRSPSSRSFSRSRSRSRTPPRRRRRSPSPSRTPPRRRRRSPSYSRSPSRDKGRRRGSDVRAKPPPSREENARSPSPRRPRHRRPSPSVSRSRSRSRSPPPKRRRHNSSSSLSRSPPRKSRGRYSPSPVGKRSTSMDVRADQNAAYGGREKGPDSPTRSKSHSRSPDSGRHRINLSSERD